MRRAVAAAVAVVVNGVMTAAAAQPAWGGIEWESYQLSASAEAIDVRLFWPTAALSDEDGTAADLGGLSVEANLDDLGTSTGRAAAVFPGDTPVTLLGLLRNPSPAPMPPFNFPLTVTSSYPASKEGSAEAPPFNLKSTSSERRSAAAAGIEGSATPMATAEVERADDDKLVADAVTELGGVEVGPLRIARLRSHSRVVRDLSGPPTVTATLEATGVRVGDTPIALGPGRSPKLAGVEVRYLAPTANESEVVSPAVEIILEVPSLPDKSLPSRIVVTLGRSKVSLTAERGETFEEDFSLQDYFEDVVVEEPEVGDEVTSDEIVDEPFPLDPIASDGEIVVEEGVTSGDPAGSTSVSQGSRRWAWAALALILPVGAVVHRQRRSSKVANTAQP